MHQSNQSTPALLPITGYFDTTAGAGAAAAPTSKSTSASISSQNQRRWSTKGDIWSFGLSLWSIAEGARPFAHLLDDEVLIAAAGKQANKGVCVYYGFDLDGNARRLIHFFHTFTSQ